MPERPSFDAFMRLRGADRRLARLTHDMALPVGSGLEFGLGNNPTPLPDGVSVEYVDYSLDAAGEVSGVDMDRVWTGPGSLAAVCGKTKAYDFAIAAQVAQYVPNLLGWFRGIYKVLKVGGVLNLSLSDRRFTSDQKRKTSSLGELLEAYYLDYDRPSLRQIVDYTHGTVILRTDQIWSRDVPADEILHLYGEHALELAHEKARTALSSGQYVLCRCWVFTPLSFLDVIESVTQLGLFPFVINQITSTEVGESDFYVSFRRDTEEDNPPLRQNQLFGIAYLREIQEKRQRLARRLAES